MNSYQHPVDDYQYQYQHQHQHAGPEAESVGNDNQYSYSNNEGNDGAAAGWVEYTNEDGYQYWYNHYTGESQWESPHDSDYTYDPHGYNHEQYSSSYEYGESVTDTDYREGYGDTTDAYTSKVQDHDYHVAAATSVGMEYGLKDAVYHSREQYVHEDSQINDRYSDTKDIPATMPMHMLQSSDSADVVDNSGKIDHISDLEVTAEFKGGSSYLNEANHSGEDLTLYSARSESIGRFSAFNSPMYKEAQYSPESLIGSPFRTARDPSFSDAREGRGSRGSSVESAGEGNRSRRHTEFAYFDNLEASAPRQELSSDLSFSQYSSYSSLQDCDQFRDATLKQSQEKNEIPTQNGSSTAVGSKDYINATAPAVRKILETAGNCQEPSPPHTLPLPNSLYIDTGIGRDEASHSNGGSGFRTSDLYLSPTMLTHRDHRSLGSSPRAGAGPQLHSPPGPAQAAECAENSSPSGIVFINPAPSPLWNAATVLGNDRINGPRSSSPPSAPSMTVGRIEGARGPPIQIAASLPPGNEVAAKKDAVDMSPLLSAPAAAPDAVQPGKPMEGGPGSDPAPRVGEVEQMQHASGAPPQRFFPECPASSSQAPDPNPHSNPNPAKQPQVPQSDSPSVSPTTPFAQDPEETSAFSEVDPEGAQHVAAPHPLLGIAGIDINIDIDTGGKGNSEMKVHQEPPHPFIPSHMSSDIDVMDADVNAEENAFLDMGRYAIHGATNIVSASDDFVEEAVSPAHVDAGSHMQLGGIQESFQFQEGISDESKREVAQSEEDGESGGGITQPISQLSPIDTSTALDTSIDIDIDAIPFYDPEVSMPQPSGHSFASTFDESAAQAAHDGADMPQADPAGDRVSTIPAPSLPSPLTLERFSTANEYPLRSVGTNSETNASLTDTLVTEITPSPAFTSAHLPDLSLPSSPETPLYSQYMDTVPRPFSPLYSPSKPAQWSPDHPAHRAHTAHPAHPAHPAHRATREVRLDGLPSRDLYDLTYSSAESADGGHREAVVYATQHSMLSPPVEQMPASPASFSASTASTHRGYTNAESPTERTYSPASDVVPRTAAVVKKSGMSTVTVSAGAYASRTYSAYGRAASGPGSAARSTPSSRQHTSSNFSTPTPQPETDWWNGSASSATPHTQNRSHSLSYGAYDGLNSSSVSTVENPMYGWEYDYNQSAAVQEPVQEPVEEPVHGAGPSNGSYPVADDRDGVATATTAPTAATSNPAPNTTGRHMAIWERFFANAIQNKAAKEEPAPPYKSKGHAKATSILRSAEAIAGVDGSQKAIGSAASSPAGSMQSTRKWPPLLDSDAFAQLLKEALDSGARQTDANGSLKSAALVASVARADLVAVRSLLAAGANAGCVDSTPPLRTPGHYAARTGRVDVLGLLLDTGADLDAPDANEQTPLHVAAQYCKMKALRFLLESAVDANSVDVQGRTPLHLAARVGSVQGCELLVSYGADMSILDHYEQDALTVAMEAKPYKNAHDIVVQRLLEHIDQQSLNDRVSSNYAVPPQFRKSTDQHKQDGIAAAMEADEISDVSDASRPRSEIDPKKRVIFQNVTPPGSASQSASASVVSRSLSPSPGVSRSVSPTESPAYSSPRSARSERSYGSYTSELSMMSEKSFVSELSKGSDRSLPSPQKAQMHADYLEYQRRFQEEQERRRQHEEQLRKQRVSPTFRPDFGDGEFLAASDSTATKPPLPRSNTQSPQPSVHSAQSAGGGSDASSVGLGGGMGGGKKPWEGLKINTSTDTTPQTSPPRSRMPAIPAMNLTSLPPRSRSPMHGGMNDSMSTYIESPRRAMREQYREGYMQREQDAHLYMHSMAVNEYDPLASPRKSALKSPKKSYSNGHLHKDSMTDDDDDDDDDEDEEEEEHFNNDIGSLLSDFIWSLAMSLISAALNLFLGPMRSLGGGKKTGSSRRIRADSGSESDRGRERRREKERERGHTPTHRVIESRIHSPLPQSPRRSRSQYVSDHVHGNYASSSGEDLGIASRSPRRRRSYVFDDDDEKLDRIIERERRSRSGTSWWGSVGSALSSVTASAAQSSRGRYKSPKAKSPAWKTAAAPPTDGELIDKGMGFQHMRPPPFVAREIKSQLNDIRSGRTPRNSDPEPPHEVAVAVSIAKARASPRHSRASSPTHRQPSSSPTAVYHSMYHSPPVPRSPRRDRSSTAPPPPSGHPNNAYSMGAIPRGVQWRYVDVLNDDQA